MRPQNFNPPTPCGVGRNLSAIKCSARYFNPPTPCGVGPGSSGMSPDREAFQSTHPVWGGTLPFLLIRVSLSFQSTHPVWGGTPGGGTGRRHYRISIHPPRVGWDEEELAELRKADISIHPPRVGWDRCSVPRTARPRNFNPPTPCGVGPTCGQALPFEQLFQSTHPVWGGT